MKKKSHKERMVRDGELYISPRLWNELKLGFHQSDIIQMISDVIAEYKIPLPYRHVTLADAKEDFKRLQGMDCTELIVDNEFYSRYEYENKFSNRYIEQSNIGNKSSDYFHQEARWRCDSINAPSPQRTWATEKFRKTLLRALWTLNYKNVDMTKMRSAIGLRKYIAAQYRPSAAKAIYQHFKAKNVLDFSSGWGDRLSAFMATDCTESYLGCDPNDRLFQQYDKQISTFNKDDKDITMVISPAEEMDFEQYVQGKSGFDLIFTSPPYFIIERYTKEDNQSWQRYKKLETWLSEFLFKVLGNAWKALKHGGHMVINISDVYCNHTNNCICDPMNDFLKGLKGAEYAGCFGYRMAKRPQSKSVGTGIFAEPQWIWRKK